jgi:hypothetical protein
MLLNSSSILPCHRIEVKNVFERLKSMLTNGIVIFTKYSKILKLN